MKYICKYLVTKVSIFSLSNFFERNTQVTMRPNFSGNYLYLRRSFHEGLRSDTGDAGDWERLPLANTLQKLRLENTKVN